MYGWLLESVQHFVVKEFGEDLWETILRDAGSKNNVFSATQQYPDALMLRIAHALSNILNNNAASPSSSKPGSPLPKKPSFKSKNSWRSASCHDNNKAVGFKCPFTATNALTAATKKEIESYNSSEELVVNVSTDELNKEEEEMRGHFGERQVSRKKSILIKLDSLKRASIDAGVPSSPILNEGPDEKSALKSPELFRHSAEATSKAPEPEVPADTENIVRKKSVVVVPIRKASTTVDVYKRRVSITPMRQRLNSLVTVSGGDRLKEKFGTPDKVMHFFGRCFVKFFTNYGYDNMIRATGRYFCTFLQSVDGIHQRMRFTFPRMRSPSMQLTRAHRHGAEIVYSSTRNGFAHYLMGQLCEIAEDMFHLKLNVNVVKESMEGTYYVAVLRLEFDNSDYVNSLMLRKSVPCPLPSIPASLLLQLFPFGVLLDRRMKILMAGDKLAAAWGGPYNRIKKSPVSDILRLRKPKIAFTWDKVVCMQTMMFELELMRWRARTSTDDARRGSQGARAILLKGPIYLLQEIDALIFLCSPIFNNLEELSQADLYLADLNGHGLSKEMLLEGWQHLSRLELLFEKAESRSMSLEKSYCLLDQWRKRGDQLLYSMIPKAIADQLRDGKDPMSVCQAFECVTAMFCGVQLNEAGTRADVLQTVAEINEVYSKIDRLLDSHRVYKVETVGTVYLVVSGAPDRRRTHAAAAASAALAVIRAVPRLTIGIHSGPCVAGVLGKRVPRYTLVGDTVNTASRMQTTSEPGRIQISSTSVALLPAGRFRLRRRGLTNVKGKGIMETFWLEGEVEEDEQDEVLQLFTALCGDAE